MESLWLVLCHFQRTSTKGFVDAQNVIPNPDIEESMMMSWILEKYLSKAIKQKGNLKNGYSRNFRTVL